MKCSLLSNAMALKPLGGGRSFYGIGRHGRAEQGGEKRPMRMCDAATQAPAADVKSFAADQIQVRIFKFLYSIAKRGYKIVGVKAVGDDLVESLLSQLKSLGFQGFMNRKMRITDVVLRIFI